MRTGYVYTLVYFFNNSVCTLVYGSFDDAKLTYDKILNDCIEKKNRIMRRVEDINKGSLSAEYVDEQGVLYCVSVIRNTVL